MGPLPDTKPSGRKGTQVRWDNWQQHHCGTAESSLSLSLSLSLTFSLSLSPHTQRERERERERARAHMHWEWTKSFESLKPVPNDIHPNSSQTVPPNGDQAFKGILYGAIFIKTATSSRDTCPPGSLSLSTGADPKEFQSQVTQAGEQEDSNPDSKTL